MRSRATRRRFPHEAGMAIGPILFILLILGVLAAAIATSSGSFTGNAGNEEARTKASALIQIGAILKSGFVRMTGAGADFNAINIDPLDTVNDSDLFAPSGGSVNVPSTTLANDPAVDTWHYPFAAVPLLGTAASERVAMLKVSRQLCNKINIQANALDTDADDAAMGADIGDVTAALLADAANWPGPVQGREIGCLRNTNGSTPGYFYFQVLGIR